MVTLDILEEGRGWCNLQDLGIKEGDYVMRLAYREKLLARRFGHSERGEISYDNKRKPRSASDTPGLSDVTRATRPTKQCQHRGNEPLMRSMKSLACPSTDAQLTDNPATVEAFAAKHTGAKEVTRRRLGYADVWQDYVAAGWTPTPLPRGKKHPPQAGVTGDPARSYQPYPRDYREWAREYPDGNVMLVMPEDVVGIDVDVYHGGDKTLDELVRAHGDLPISPETTSRDDGSGIGFYRVQPGTRLRGVAGPGIECIQQHHRYAIVWPSVHPEGRMYRWWLGDTPTNIPRVQDLPWLPDEWLKALTDKPKATSKNGTPYSGDVDTWLSELPDRPTPASVRKIVRDAERAFGAGASRHDTMVQATGALVAMGARGKAVFNAVFELEVLFCGAVASDREGTEEREYWSAVEGAIKGWGGRKPRKRCPGVSDADLTEAAARIAGRSS
jgi:hypothetical protein